MKRAPVVLANWKLNGSVPSTHAWLDTMMRMPQNEAKDLVQVLLPPAILLPVVMQWMRDHKTKIDMQWGAQHVSDQEQGAYTGEISAKQLRECDCRYTLVGHSERRIHYGESDQQVGKQFACALEQGLIAVACVGETADDHERAQTHAVLARQLRALLEATPESSGKQVIIAYEPVWAIGSGKAASPALANECHAYIREQWTKLGGKDASDLTIVYGGSANADNAADFASAHDIDGLLVGGASLDAVEFHALCRVFASVKIATLNHSI